ncbi:MAG: hypothetical protein ACPGC8_00755 [Flavobacteriaceae bacterium]
MSELFQKYKGLFLILFLGLFISFVDGFVLSGQFKGVEEYKHFIYIGALLIGLVVVLSILLKEGPAEE